MPLRDNFTPREGEDILTGAMKNLGLKRADAENPAIRRHVDVDRAHEVVDAIQKKAKYDDGRVAVNFAHKVGPHVERLAQAMKTLDSEREKDRVQSATRRPAVERSWLTRR